MGIPITSPTITTYNFTGIKFVRDTTENRGIAESVLGYDASTPIQDEITPVSLATGTITFDGGGGSPNTVTGVGTAFLSDFRVGNFLFYYDALGNPALVGQIDAIGNNSTLTLVDAATTTKTDVYCGASNTLIATNEKILVAIPASLLGTNGVYIPNWNAFRDAPISSGSTNNETYIAMSQISSVGSPSTPISPVNIDFTISSINNWVVSPTGTVWATASQFPVYCWAEIAPNANSGATLAPTTLYKMFVQESFQSNAVLATTVYDIVLLRAAGYQI